MVGFNTYNENRTDPHPHIHGLWITWLDTLREYYEVPHFTEEVLDFVGGYLYFDNEKANDQEKDLIEENTMESMHCLTHGSETFRFVSPLFRQNLYVNNRKSPVNLFHEPRYESIEEFPLLQQAVVHEVKLNPGECLYVPAFWWMQSNTPHGGESIYLEFKFEVVSQLWQLITKAIDSEIMLDYENHVTKV